MKLTSIFFTSMVFVCLLITGRYGNVEINYPKGGYDYPKNINSTDMNHYSYPIRNLMGTRDSFYSCYYGHYWGMAYKEPNISIKPQDEDMFRLIYETAFGGDVIFILTKNEIIVKQPKKGSPYPEYDSTKLTAIQRDHYQLLKLRFPLEPGYKRIDSLLKLYPKLNDPAYYRYLLDKSEILKKDTFTYAMKRVSVSRSLYLKLVRLMNASGYWELPYKINCDAGVADGYGFILEANTRSKYNYVGASSCPGDISKFREACQAIIDAAKVDKKITVIWKE
jgi:hypothetical protein